MRIVFKGDKETVEKAEWCLSILLGEYSAEQQYAASIMLKMLLKEEYDKFTEYFKEITPFKVNNRCNGKITPWKKRVKKKGVCEICGATDHLQAHHIIPWADSIAGRFDVNNGQCLCKDCHAMMHDDVLWLEYMANKVSKNE